MVCEVLGEAGWWVFEVPEDSPTLISAVRLLLEPVVRLLLETVVRLVPETAVSPVRLAETGLPSASFSRPPSGPPGW